MARTFATAATKRTVLAAVSPILLRTGYAIIEQEKGSLATSFERQLSEDVRELVTLTFFDGPIAGKSIVWMTGGMALSSARLLGTYDSLMGTIRREKYFPVSVSFDSLVQSLGTGGWKFELPDIAGTVASFEHVLESRVEPVARELDSAEKQAARLVSGPYKNAYWNPSFFQPIAHLILGAKGEAAEAARGIFESASGAFAESYEPFLRRVLGAAA